MKRILKKAFGAIMAAALLLTPIRSNAMDFDHVKIGVENVGKCYNTTFDTFNYIGFLLKHPEIGYPDKETAWAYYEMYCKPNGELAPCNLKAYMDYTQFDIDYFLDANGIGRTSDVTDKEIFDIYCDYSWLYDLKGRGLTDHANALINAYNSFWAAYLFDKSDFEIILNFYLGPANYIDYYTPDDPYSEPDIWNLVTSIDGPMLYGIGNCQGYANYFMFLMDMAGYPSRTVYSETHMWNEVLYNGTWYACDTCWADIQDFPTLATSVWFMITYY